MTTFEIAFLDAYKRMDAACADMLHDKNGVTAYLNYMDTIPSVDHQGIGSWSYDRSTLVRLRHVRNQIAHNAGPSSCTKEDLDKLKNFYGRLLHGEDALSEYMWLCKARQAMQKKQEKQHGRIKEKRRSRKRIRLIFLAVFLVILIVISCIAVAFLFHV